MYSGAQLGGASPPLAPLEMLRGGQKKLPFAECLVARMNIFQFLTCKLILNSDEVLQLQVEYLQETQPLINLFLKQTFLIII